MENYRIILELICLLACVLHAVIGYFHNKAQGKKIDRLCEKCGVPHSVEDDCKLSDVQVQKLIEMVKGLKKNISEDEKKNDRSGRQDLSELTGTGAGEPGEHKEATDVFGYTE